jgi:toxin secretion/phage lysis holin
METYFTEAKAAIAIFFTAITTLLGWQGVMALVWVVLMIMDYLSGSWAARKTGTWKSSVARDGFLHKGGMILVVLVALLADIVMGIALPHIPVLNIAWPDILFPTVLAWYIITELGSILENAVKMGTRVPSWLTKIFNAGLKVIDATGDQMSDAAEGAHPAKDADE